MSSGGPHRRSFPAPGRPVAGRIAGVGLVPHAVRVPTGGAASLAGKPARNPAPVDRPHPRRTRDAATATVASWALRHAGAPRSMRSGQRARCSSAASPADPRVRGLPGPRPGDLAEAVHRYPA